MARKKRTPPETCPVCGEDVPRNAAACPGCGADHDSGWNEDDARHSALDLADDNFNYDEFVKNEFGGSPKPRGIKTIWWVTGIAILIAFAWHFLAR